MKIQYMLHNDCLFRAVLHTKTVCPDRRLNLACTMGSSGLPQTIKIQDLCNALTQTRVKIQQRCTMNLHYARKQHSVGWYDVCWIFTRVCVSALLFRQWNAVSHQQGWAHRALQDQHKMYSHHTTIHHFNFTRSHIRVCLAVFYHLWH